jgi:Xaa-Pro dipeptidase
MLVLRGGQRGLVCSIRLLVHFGPIPEEIARRIQAALVNAALIAPSRPCMSLGFALEQGTQAYARAGYPEEWPNHHQGKVAGYESREYLATTGSNDLTYAGQALARNASIAGGMM